MQDKIKLPYKVKEALQITLILMVINITQCEIQSNVESNSQNQNPILQICEEMCEELHREHDFIRSICEGHCLNYRCYQKVYGDYVIDFMDSKFKNLPDDYVSLEQKRREFMECWQAEKDSGADTVEEEFYLIQDTMKMFTQEAMHQNILKHDFSRQLHAIQEEQFSGMNFFQICYDQCINFKNLQQEFDFFADTLCSSKCFNEKCFHQVYSPYIINLETKKFQNIPDAVDTDEYFNLVYSLLNQFEKCSEENQLHQLFDIEGEEFSLNEEP